MFVNPITASKPSQSFQGGMAVYDRLAQYKILKNCSPKQFEEIKDIFKKQQNDKLFCFIYASENNKRLEARIMCTHFIRNFKEYYKQIPIFESDFRFIKRMSKRMDKYKEQLDNAARKENESK